jgi:AcrR family transcriptional regulator
MAPPRKHDTDTILDAVRALALRDGPRAVSVAAIARESGAPVGTLYHRFKNRDGLVSAAWLRALYWFHARWLAAAQEPDPLEAGVAMAVSVVAFAREHPDDAQLLLTLRRSDLLDAHGDAPALNTPVHEQIVRLAGSTDPRALDRVTRAIVDIPYAAVRRHRHPLPDWLEAEVADAARALLTTTANIAGKEGGWFGAARSR